MLLLSRLLRPTALARAFSTTVFAGLSGCVPEFADDTTRVTEARVLAVRAEPAEVEPGDEVTFEALVALPPGERLDAERYSWARCAARKPLTEPGPVEPQCVTAFPGQDPSLVALGRGLSTTAALPGDVCRQFGPLTPPPTAGETVGGRPVDPDATGGFYVPVIVGDHHGTLGRVRVACGDLTLPNAERLKFTRGYHKNQNPALEALSASWDGARHDVDEGPLQVSAGARVTWTAQWARCAEDAPACSGAEGYLLPDPERRVAARVTEVLRVAWFASGGDFDNAQTGEVAPERSENVWTAPLEAGPVNLWVVVRDDRGGTAWRSITLEVTAR